MAKIVGIEKVNYTNKKTDKPVTGYRVSTVEINPETIGQKAECEFISEEYGALFFNQFKDLNEALGREIKYWRNQWGRVDGIYDLTAGTK